ncbi:uncharacterized protein [Cicer arietinum]|uniref:uncharacterized protein n=1 Tax=Cicer arietinum TaxID=3827 RepID=UPI003CC5B96C
MADVDSEFDSEFVDEETWMFSTAKLKHQSWYLDNGCSRNMKGERSIFQDLTLTNGDLVNFGGKQKGKQTKSSFPSKNIVSSSRPLELLLFDLFCPVKTTKLNGKRYALVIVEDYSRWTWVKFLKHKDESHKVFTTFCNQVQNKKQFFIGTIYSDHGGEFENKLFEKFYEEAILYTISHSLEHLNIMVKDIVGLQEPEEIDKSKDNDKPKEPYKLEDTRKLEEHDKTSQNELDQTKSSLKDTTLFGMLSSIEPTSIDEAQADNGWILAMEEELNDFKKNDVLDLVPRPKDKRPIRTKWVFKNKSNEKGEIVRNKARLVAQGYNKQKGIDYTKT